MLNLLKYQAVIITKKQLNDFVYGNWEIDSLIADKNRENGDGC